MKTFDYIKNIIKVIAWPILLGIGQFFIILIFSYSFNNNIYNNYFLISKLYCNFL
jgi:hypothetical protein